MVFTNCLICGNNHLNQLPAFKETFLVKCAHCKFVFVGKAPSEEELAKYYGAYGRNAYLSPVTITRYNELLDQLEMYKSTKRMLDIGCGKGYFLNEAKKRGWEVFGTEYNHQDVELCKNNGIEMHYGSLNIDNYPSGYFDVITSFEVIEHINNPLDEVLKINYLLRPGGLVYLTTPNFNSITRNYLGNKWDVIFYPEHLSYYSAKTINFLFSKNGFSKLKIRTTGISINRWKVTKTKAFQNPIKSGTDDEKFRTMAETKWYIKIIKDFLNAMLSLFRKGETIKAFFIKVK